jgi:DEAD/DEAH box helicase domain-containing protein
LATGTASGKTLSFAIPVFDLLLKDKEARAIFFYPTKALAGDQLKSLQSLANDLGMSGTVFRFDGDVSTDGRRKALTVGRLLLCTPDVLHMTMLKRHKEPLYDDFFTHLRAIVLDECHVYSGAFGSNLAFVLRRLRQVCALKNAKPQWLAASATSLDPGNHLKLLTSETFVVIDEEQNGSPSGGRRYIMANYLDDGQVASVNHLIARLAVERKRFIVFCHSRRLTEQYYHELTTAHPNLVGRVMPYRAGYEPTDRQGIEDALRSSTLVGVISTSALELGVDLPEMEYCILIGLPTTNMSFMQRVGRVGRTPAQQGKVIIFPSDNAIDNYYRRHPEKIYTRPLEKLVLHLDNRQLILSHFACARYESCNFDKPELDPNIFGKDFVELSARINNLESVDDILVSNDPHAMLGIRGIGDPTYEIYLSGGESRLGTITWSQILREAYPKAVYRHMGDAYRVERIVTRDFVVKVKRENRNHITSPVGHVFVRERTGLGAVVFRRSTWQDKIEMLHTNMIVTTVTSGFREKVGDRWVQEKYPAPLQRRVFSEGVWFRLLPAFGEVTRSGLNTFVHALSSAYSIYMPCDSAEISTHSVRKPDGSSCMYVFDNTSGGLGISAGLFGCFEDLLPMVEERLTSCDHCDADRFNAGCPACVQGPRWYDDNEHLNKEEALAILSSLREVLSDTKPDIVVSSAYQHRDQGGLTSISEMGYDDFPQKFGVRVFAPGSTVRLPSGIVGEVRDILIENGQCHYALLLANGKPASVRDMGMVLIEGDQSLLCGCCGSSCAIDARYCQNCMAEVG